MIAEQALKSNRVVVKLLVEKINRKLKNGMVFPTRLPGFLFVLTMYQITGEIPSGKHLMAGSLIDKWVLLCYDEPCEKTGAAIERGTWRK